MNMLKEIEFKPIALSELKKKSEKDAATNLKERKSNKLEAVVMGALASIFIAYFIFKLTNSKFDVSSLCRFLIVYATSFLGASSLSFLKLVNGKDKRKCNAEFLYALTTNSLQLIRKCQEVLGVEICGDTLTVVFSEEGRVQSVEFCIKEVEVKTDINNIVVEYIENDTVKVFIPFQNIEQLREINSNGKLREINFLYSRYDCSKVKSWVVD